MRLTFHPDVEMRLREVGRAAADIGVQAFAVGGVVRDALRGHENKDVDVTVVGDALRLYRRFADEWSGAASVYPEFGTASLEDADGFRMDFATARSETYRRPGSLPSIRPATLREDLARRDFSVNAIAASLLEETFGDLADPFNGRLDLQAGSFRILHPRSFLDDPTRLFRAARYAVRLGLVPDAETDEAAREAVAHGAVRTVSADRRRREVTLICAEPRWADTLGWLNRWGLWESLHEGFQVRPRSLSRIDVARQWMLRHTREAVPDAGEARFLSLLHAVPALARRVLKPRPAESSILEKADAIIASLCEGESPSWHRAMDELPPAAFLPAFAAVPSDSDKRRLTRYLAEVRPVRLDINGHDLRRAGVAEGPAIRAALDRTLDAVRAGAVSGRREQRDYAVRQARGESADR